MADSFDNLINSEQLVLVDFFADWCGPCKMMPPILTEVKTVYKERLKIIKINVDANPELASRLSVKGVPTIILFKEGKVVWRQSGVASKDMLINLVKENM